MDANQDKIKSEFVTYKLFVDSAIRAKLRVLGIDAGQDEIIPHLEKLEASKSRRLDKQAISQAKLRHKRRMARAQSNLNKI